jgi:hypothetical protein
MPIEPFEGNTWVAFLDMCGFKKMVSKPQRAKEALSKFYNTVYNVNRTYHENYGSNFGSVTINSLIMSDCAVIFVDDRSRNIENWEAAKAENLNVLLWAVSSINRVLINPNRGPQIMTICAIDHGYFEYAKRTEDEHTQKNLFFGEAYLNAFLKTEEKKGLKKTPGYCKVIKRDFIVPPANDQLLSLREDGECYNYYWMTIDPRQIDSFETKYKLITQSGRRRTSTYYRDIMTLLHKTSNETFGETNLYKRARCDLT